MGKHTPMTGAERAAGIAKQREAMRKRTVAVDMLRAVEESEADIMAWVEAMQEEVWASLPPYEWPVGEEPETA